MKEEVTAEEGAKKFPPLGPPPPDFAFRADEGPRNSSGRRWRVHCRKIKRNGDVCGNWAIHGHWVCTKHGGQLPSVRALGEARYRDERLLNGSVEELEWAMAPWKRQKMRFQAAKIVLRMHIEQLVQGVRDGGDFKEIDAFLARLEKEPEDGGVREPAPSPPPAPSTPATVPVPEPDRELVDA